ncbi:MAG: hypothetical protein IPP71_03360 [Bacteroidetes bacterium]|nr:hypothetical protein [Bacteroidota bacterium]
MAGIKVPLNYSNNKNADGQPLPLDYQSSIGTYDLILGFRAAIKKITLSAGAQLPLEQVNENAFFPELYTDSAAYKYSPTNDFERKSDLLFRASYNIAFEKSSILLQPNLLAIYHLGNDSYFDLSGTRVTIENSQGLTLNAGATTTKSFKNASALEILIAAPLVVREVRPDGLTRSFVLNLQYKIPF